MILDEILPLEYEPAPAFQFARLLVQQEAEQEVRNRAAIIAWYEREFGPDAGRVLAHEHNLKWRIS